MNNCVKAEVISGWQQSASASMDLGQVIFALRPMGNYVKHSFHLVTYGNEYCVVAKGDQHKLQIFKETLIEN
jgi:hypothetical protein